jgi:hypothetical protein
MSQVSLSKVQRSWTHMLLSGGGIESPDESDMESARTVPRDRHRLWWGCEVRTMVKHRARWVLPPLDARINGRGETAGAARPELLPSWRRGELRHAEPSEARRND